MTKDDQMSYRIVDHPEQGLVELLVAGDCAGTVTYTRQPAMVTVTHITVDDRFAGQGLGALLAQTVLDSARASGTAVVPLCPFLTQYLRRHPEYHAVVPADERARLGLHDVSDAAGQGDPGEAAVESRNKGEGQGC